ncbi:hypothetical protein GUJ93_ZPchr0009g1393 [Zizania palustris]|uniref:RRM domain-containing protein n=1 Tax=Zizania palustris TaxID=103762 RepID=A0A8J5RP46_ZIZPA|nr:hypothetical protein GUJ93_ZPchr0009g1393 [Zizania palustris]
MDPDGDGAFHRNEAISAVQDVDQYYGDDDDYDDLYNDVNVGDGFLQSSHTPAQSQPPPPPPMLATQQQQQAPPQTAPQQQQLQPPPSLPPPMPQPPLRQPEKVHIPGVVAVPAPVPDRPNPTHLTPQPLPLVAAAPPPPLHNQIQTSGGDVFHRQGGGNYGGGAIVVGNGGGGDGPGGTTLFVGELHWWTTDADLEAELSKYGQVKEVRFFDEKASGKSKGYCQVDFYDPGAAATCKEGMNGHLFNGRPCVVAFASPHTVRRMGEAQVKNHQSMAQQNSAMGRMGGGFGGFPGGPGSAPFPGLMQPFPPVVAPHVNPAFFGRGGGMGAGGVGMWPDPSMGGWGGRSKQAMVMMQHLTSNMVRVGAMWILAACLQGSVLALIEIDKSSWSKDCYGLNFLPSSNSRCSCRLHAYPYHYYHIVLKCGVMP